MNAVQVDMEGMRVEVISATEAQEKELKEDRVDRAVVVVVAAAAARAVETEAERAADLTEDLVAVVGTEAEQVAEIVPAEAHRGKNRVDYQREKAGNNCTFAQLFSKAS